MRRLFNIYKLRRKWGRVQRIRLRTAEAIAVRRDFAWHRRKTNPLIYFPWGQTLKRKLQLSTIAAAFLALVLVLIYHPFFLLRQIEVKGVEKLDSEEIERAVSATLRHRRWLILPGQNFFVSDLKELHEVLQSRFPLASLAMQKNFPNQLEVTIVERLSTMIYDNGYQYSQVGPDGRITEILRQVGEDEWTKPISTTPSSTNNDASTSTESMKVSHVPPVKRLQSEFGYYPIIYDDSQNSSFNPLVINQLVFSPEMAQGILRWFNVLQDQWHISFGYIKINPVTGEGIVDTAEGWQLKAKLDEQLDRQIQSLELVLKEILARSKLQYIDVRFPERVYWQ